MQCLRRRAFIGFLCLLLGGVSVAHAAVPVPSVQAELLAASQPLNTYEINAEFDPETASLSCVQRVRYTNRTGEPLSSLVFRVYANAFAAPETTPALTADGTALPFSAGGLSLSRALVNGVEVAPVWIGEDNTSLVFALTLAPEASVDVELAYRVRLPAHAYRFGASDGFFLFDRAFPQLAVYESGAFCEEAYLPIGDPFYSECANYRLFLTLPQGYSAATSGTTLEASRQGELQITAYEALAVRDFGLVISRQQAFAERQENGVLLQSFAQTREQARAALELLAQSLSFFETHLGDYPYPVLAIAQANLGFMGGMEYPAMVVVNRHLYQPGQEDNLRRAIAHEVAHQWFYALVGTDQLKEPWLDEGLAEYLAAVVLREARGQAVFEDYLATEIEPAMRVSLPPGIVIASPLWQYTTWSEYDRVVYKRAAGMMQGLHLAMGDEAFFGALQVLLKDHSFGFAGREDFAEALQQASGANWRGYLDDYLDSRN